MSDEMKRPYSTPTLRALPMQPYTEEQIRADIQAIEESDLSDDVALALMRLAHALCGSSMLRGLIARSHRQDAIVRAVVERRDSLQRVDGGEVPTTRNRVLCIDADCKDHGPKRGAGDYHLRGTESSIVPQPVASPGSVVASHTFVTKPIETVAQCGMCSTEYASDEYAKLDSARESHFRRCNNCSSYEVRPK